MKKVLLYLATSLLLAAPVSAQSSTDLPALAQQQFLSAHTSQGLIGCNSNSDHGLIFAPGTSVDNINAVQAAAATYDWTGASIKVPDVVGFFTAIATDQNLPAAARVQLPLSEYLLQQQLQSGNTALINSYVTDLVTSGAYPYMTLPAIMEVLALASTYNMPISAPTVPAGAANLTGFKLGIIQDTNIPIQTKLQLYTYAQTLTDLIGYANTTNPSITLSASVSSGANAVIPITTLDPSLVVGELILINDGTNKELELISATSTSSTVVITNPDRTTSTIQTPTITVSNLTNNYGTNASVTAPNLLQQTWIAIETNNAAIGQATCVNGTPVPVEIQNLATANGFSLSPL